MVFYTNPHTRSQISALADPAAPLSVESSSDRRTAPAVAGSTAERLNQRQSSPTPTVEWYGKEIGLSYDSVAIDMGKQEHKKQPFLAVNPFGKLPAVKVCLSAADSLM